MTSVLNPARYFRDLMDPERTPIQEFLEFYEVASTSGGWDEDIYVPFYLRPKQQELLDKILWCWNKGRGAKILVLKERQGGVSTFVQSLFSERLLRVPGISGLTICQDDDETVEMFAKLRGFISQIPEQFRPPMPKDRERGVRVQHTDSRTASMRVMTAGRVTLGRGTSNQLLHISEFPHWPRGKDKLPALLKSFHNKPGGCLVIESTAKGYEEFYDLWANAQKGLNDYIPFFSNWLAHPDYHLDFHDQVDEEAFNADLGTHDRYGGVIEITLRDQHGASLEQLKWRRMQLDGDLQGSLPLFNQEFPTTPEDAFQSTGRPVFPLDLVRAHMPFAKEVEKAGVRTDLIAGRTGSVIQVDEPYDTYVKGVANPTGGRWKVFKEPEEDTPYCWGCDVASGHEVHADGKTEADYSTCTVKEVTTGKTVARLRAHIFPEELAAEVAKMAFYYGNAAGLVESNNDGGHVISRIQDEQIGEMTGDEILLTKPRIVVTAGKRMTVREPGYTTTRKTKPPLIGQLVAYINGQAPNEGTPFDELTLKEMMRYVRTGIGGMEADTGHDDLVMSESLALMARSEMLHDLPRLSRVPPRMDDFQQLIAYDLAQSASARKDRPGYDETLGDQF